MSEKGERDVSLFSFHSCSKGFLGECGQRGGYMELRNIPADVVAEVTKLQSVALCANLTGQVATYCMVRPPRAGEPSHALYAHERDGVLGELRARAVLLAEGLNRIDGIECNVVAGAMYAFPRVTLPPGRTDEEYCMALLEETGICVVPGTGFGQVPGTAHFRTTILPSTDRIRMVVEKLRLVSRVVLRHAVGWRRRAAAGSFTGGLGRSRFAAGPRGGGEVTGRGRSA